MLYTQQSINCRFLNDPVTIDLWLELCVWCLIARLSAQFSYYFSFYGFDISGRADNVSIIPWARNIQSCIGELQEKGWRTYGSRSWRSWMGNHPCNEVGIKLSHYLHLKYDSRNWMKCIANILQAQLEVKLTLIFIIQVNPESWIKSI